MSSPDLTACEHADRFDGVLGQGRGSGRDPLAAREADSQRDRIARVAVLLRDAPVSDISLEAFSALPSAALKLPEGVAVVQVIAVALTEVVATEWLTVADGQLASHPDPVAELVGLFGIVDWTNTNRYVTAQRCEGQLRTALANMPELAPSLERAWRLAHIMYLQGLAEHLGELTALTPSGCCAAPTGMSRCLRGAGVCSWLAAPDSLVAAPRRRSTSCGGRP